MKIKIDWVENKNPDWKVATVVSPDGYKTENVSINRKSNSGEVFPNFDGLMPGIEVECELWKSKAGKWYMFAPKPQGEANRGQSGGFKKNIEKVMETKKENIRVSQENKEHGIKVSSTFSSAKDMTIAFPEYWETDNLQEEFRKWRQWLWQEWDKEDKDFPPFN